MSKLLQVDFQVPGSFSPEMGKQMLELAKSINNESGMIWKIWTYESHGTLAGGVYLFEDEQTAKQYLEMHSKRLVKMGITDVRGVIFDINAPLTEINQGPISQVH